RAPPAASPPASFAMDTQRALAWTAQLHGYEALTILADCRVLATPGFPAVEDRGRPVDRPALDKARRVDAVRGAASRVGRRNPEPPDQMRRHTLSPPPRDASCP